MNMQEIRSIAKEFGIKTAKMTKITLVREIQLLEGNFDCFATAIENRCDQCDCLWREDCFAAAKKAKIEFSVSIPLKGRFLPGEIGAHGRALQLSPHFFTAKKSRGTMHCSHQFGTEIMLENKSVGGFQFDIFQ